MKVPAEPVEGEWYEFVIPVSDEYGTSYTRGKFKYFDPLRQHYVFTVREPMPLEALMREVEELPEMVVRFDRSGIEYHVKLPMEESNPFIAAVQELALLLHESTKRRKRGELEL